MTQVDFYLVERGERDAFVCRLVEKVVALGNDVFIHTPSEAATRAINELLWTFREGSFIAHEIARSPAPDADCPVLLGHDVEPEGQRAVLVNLDRGVPLFFSRFERVLEVLADEATERDAARARYAFYRDRGYPLEYHKVAA